MCMGHGPWGLQVEGRELCACGGAAGMDREEVVCVARLSKVSLVELCKGEGAVGHGDLAW